MDIITFIQPLYFLLPAYFADAAPVFFRKIKFLSSPVDFGKKLGKKPLFGSHKTWRGIFSATIFGFLVFYFQKIIYSSGLLTGASLVNYSVLPFYLGALMGFGAIAGDLVKSFFKRRFSIAPGKRWIPFDQIDFVIGALAFSSFYYASALWVWVYLCAITIPIHILLKHASYRIGMDRQEW